jgi:hypothetical protein
VQTGLLFLRVRPLSSLTFSDVAEANYVSFGVIDGKITETGSYTALVAREDSRFRTLMAAQIAAAAGEKPGESLSSPPQ